MLNVECRSLKESSNRRMFILATICTWLAWVSMALAAPGPGGSAGFEGAPGFEGSWKAKVPGPSGQSGMPVTFTFTFKDGRTDGTVSTDERSFALVDVKIDGSTITFAVEGEEQNKYSGTLSGDEIRMQVKYPSHENGTRVWSFVANKVEGRSEKVEGRSEKAEGRSEKAEERTAEGAGPSVDGEWEGGRSRGAVGAPSRRGSRFTPTERSSREALRRSAMCFRSRRGRSPGRRSHSGLPARRETTREPSARMKSR
jgi:hypothetical protein